MSTRISIYDHHHPNHDDHQLYLIVFKAQQGLFDLDRLEVHLLGFLVSAIIMMMRRTTMMTTKMMTTTMMTTTTMTTMMKLTMKSPLHCLIEPAEVAVVLRCLHVALTKAG